ncbi:MAG: glycine zipper 2TM domain-containing protein [Pseudomonadota bacterium]
MRTPFLLALIASVAIPAMPALAQNARGQMTVDIRTDSQDRRGDRHSRADLQRAYNQDVAEANRDYRRDLRNARSARARREARNDYDRALADARRTFDAGLQYASYDRDGRDGRDGRGNRDWRSYRNYDYDRPEPGQTEYYADQYYREDASYQERTLSRDERVYRGRDGRYYCRRSDGTTGLIVGAVAGGLFGNAVSNGRSSTLGTLLGAAVGASVGASIDRNNVRCR